MKKWLVACLLAIALLFVATTAMADRRKANGDNCIGQTFQLLNATENEHTLHLLQREFYRGAFDLERSYVYAESAVQRLSYTLRRLRAAPEAPTSASANTMIHTPKRRIVPSA